MGRYPPSPVASSDPRPVFPSRLLLCVIAMSALIDVAAVPARRGLANPTIGEEELDRLKQSILQGLGLNRAPDASKMNVSQEEYTRMYGVYLRSVEENRRRRQQEMENERLNEFTSQRFYSFTHTDQSERLRRSANTDTKLKHRQKSSTWLYFPLDIQEDSQQVVVEHATLRLFVSGLHPDEVARYGNTVNVRVYQVLQADKEGFPYEITNEPEETRLLIDHRRIHLVESASKWTEFDVTKATEAWVNGGASNLGLEVECRECDRRGIRLVTPDTQGSNYSVSPVLNVMANIHVIRTPKRKRSTSASDPLSNTHRSRRTECRKDGQRCCRHKMEVVFKDLEGFGFILQPKSFDAGYCKGRCPPRYNPAHHHALLQSLIWKQDRERAPRPCCAPNKLTELEILHLDEQDHTKLKVSNWKNIRVLECACS